MSLMKTLGRVAAGVILAKGLGTAMQQRQQGRPGGQIPQRRSGQGGLLGDLFGNNTGPGQGGNLGDMLGQVLGGGRPGSGSRYGGPQSRGAQGGLGGILDNLTNKARTGGSAGGSGGLGDLLNQLGGGSKTRSAGAGGGLGDLLGGLLGRCRGRCRRQPGAQGFPAHQRRQLRRIVQRRRHQQRRARGRPDPEQNAVAGLMLRAMIQAAKSDGTIDEEEKQRLLGKLGDELDEEERAFIREQMAAPVDPEALAREVPKGLESQVYLMSLLAIDLDHEDEARYLDRLARAMNLDRPTVNEIHAEVGATKLYN
ncbi:DUF533 domain-containing protein [Paracoccus aerius]